MSSQKTNVDNRNKRNISNEDKSKGKENNKIIEKGTTDNEQKPCQCDENGKEEEDLQKEEEEKMMLEQKQAEEIAQEAQERVEAKKALRKQNIDAPSNRPQESFFRRLDSNIKKNSSFIKKLKTMTEQQKQSLTQEFNGLNLTRFIQEAVSAIVEGLHKLKVADVSIVVHICGLFHQRYAEFIGSLISELMKMFENYSCKDEEKVANINKFRVGLRLLAELCIYGIIGNLDEGTKLLTSILNNIANCDMESHSYLPVILSFCRHCGEDVVGMISRKQRLLSEKYDVTIPRSQIIPAERQATVFSILKVYYQSLVSHLLKEHNELQRKEKQNRQILLSKGELHDDRKEAYEKCQKSYDKLLTNTSTLAEILDQDMPDLPESESLPEEDASGGINIFNPFKLTEYDGDTGLWEDEDTRTFYENLKDLKSLVPSILYKESSKAENSETTDDAKKTSKDEIVNGLDDDTIMSDDDENFNEMTEEDHEHDEAGADDNNAGVASGNQSNPMSNQLEQIIQRLPTCVNRDFIDDLATDFVTTCNTKGNRKKLCKALFNVPRTRFDLLPFYSRLVATLNPCMPDLAVELFSSLRSEFKWHIRKKDQIYVESKVKTVRFIAELTKFDMVPKKETLHCLKILLDNFTHHNVEMACSLLETCGRYLFRSADSHIKTKNFLEQMMRKKAVQNLDSRQKTMIDNAFYYTNPPERQKVIRKQRPPMQEYVRKLIYKDLSKTTTEKVLRQLRKLPWDQEEIVTYVVRYLIRSWNIKYSNIHCAANLLAGLAPYHEQVGIEVVDGVLEEIRIGMEINIAKMNQCRISSVKYLGELYNYQLIEANVIFTVLYSFITFGNAEDGSPSVLDPPEHLFRIRLVCILLDTCGQYFDRGSLKRKLDCFIVYFQAYIWKKTSNAAWNENCPFPKEVEYMVADTVESLRPRLKLYTSLEEAVNAVEDLNKEYQMKIDEVVKVVVTESDSKPIPLTLTNSNRGLHSGSPVISQSPHAVEREEEGSETGESEAEDMELEEGIEGDDGNKRKRGGDVFNLDDDEISEIDSEQEGENQIKGMSGPKLVPCEEDTEFLSEFQKLLVDDFQSRRTENVKVPSFDVAVPMQLGKKKTGNNEASRVNFMVMLKKGNRQQLRDLKVPISSDLAANIREKQQEEQAEQEEVKRLVLDYNKRQEEETLNELMAQTRQSTPGNRFRGRRDYKPKPANRTRDGDSAFFMNKKR